MRRAILIQDETHFLFLGLNPILKGNSDSDGWISTVTETERTNRVHGAVCPREVQVDQAVGLGQEHVQVLQGNKDNVF